METRNIPPQPEKVIDYQYIRNLKNREVRKSRFKKTLSQRILRLFLAVVLTAEAVYLGYQGFRLAQLSPWFALSRVEVTGTHRTSPDEIKKMILSQQKSALLLDLTKVKLQLENHPWIESAVLWRELPDSIRIHIKEREPVALVLEGNLYLVDRSGRIIDAFQQEPEYAGLPVITGVGDLKNEVEIRKSLQVVEALSSDPAILQQVSEIHAYDDSNTILYLKGHSFGLLVSKNDILPMVRKYMAFSDFVKRNYSNVKLIDLRFRGQIIVKDAYREQL
jgi:cell division protein FtsQ